MEQLRCVVERKTYENEENGYSVLQTKVKNYNELVTIVGNMSGVYVGSVLNVYGSWKNDAKYGRQFIAEKWEESRPATVLGIEKYLGSGLIKGVGPKFARRIVDKFGKDSLQILDETPDLLIDVDGIGLIRVEMIKKAWAAQKEIKQIMIFLQEHDVSTTLAVKIFKQYGNDSIKIVTENPYKLADDIWGIGFKTADTIAVKLGMKKDSYMRTRSGIIYTLNKLSEEGHCYARRDQLVMKAIAILEVDESIIQMTLDDMIVQKDVFRETLDINKYAIYLPAFYYSEIGVARRIKEILNTPSQNLTIREPVIHDIQYSELQLKAINTALESKVMVLTGGPGTGKTTTMLGMIKAFGQFKQTILLAAPTGRAAKRMSETTGREAKTIHRLLEYNPQEGYNFNDKNQLEGDILILDEVSMVDIILMYNLLKAIPNTMRIIFVGDIDQLPSVGAGNVLRDIISSGIIPIVELNEIFRQAQDSDIIMNAHRINHGERPVINNKTSKDFFFEAKDEKEDIVNTIIELCTKRLPKKFNFNPIKDIQVLTPMQRGEIGVQKLNELLQKILNPNQTAILQRGGISYATGDKVMQIKNNYEKSVFNGDIGFISKVDIEDRELVVVFDGIEVLYDISELDELVLAYACTIHKSQGSEYPVVILPLHTSHYMMLQRNLIYTGITRAKKLLVLVGSIKALFMAIGNNKVLERNTMLAERLKGLS